MTTTLRSIPRWGEDPRGDHMRQRADRTGWTPSTLARRCDPGDGLIAFTREAGRFSHLNHRPTSVVAVAGEGAPGADSFFNFLLSGLPERTRCSAPAMV